MWTLTALWLAFTLAGFPGETGIALSYVESRHTPGAVSSTGCLGLCQVAPAYSPVPAWALRTTIGGAVGGAIAARYWRDRLGAKWPRGYACGVRHDRPACLRYEARLKALIRAWGRRDDLTQKSVDARINRA